MPRSLWLLCTGNEELKCICPFFVEVKKSMAFSAHVQFKTWPFVEKELVFLDLEIIFLIIQDFSIAFYTVYTFHAASEMFHV